MLEQVVVFRSTLLTGCLIIGCILTSACGGGSGGHLRFMNAAPDYSKLDLLVDGTSSASGISYSTTSGYQSVNSGSRHIQVEPTGTSTFIVDQNISVSSGGFYTVLASGLSSSISGLVFTDDNTAPTSGNIKLRLVNAAPSLGAADVYVVAPGTDITGVVPTVAGLVYQTTSTYQSLAAGNYEILFTSAGQKFVNIDSGALSLIAGQIRTVVGLNSQTGGYMTAVLSDLN